MKKKIEIPDIDLYEEYMKLDKQAVETIAFLRNTLEVMSETENNEEFKAMQNKISKRLDEMEGKLAENNISAQINHKLKQQHR